MNKRILELIDHIAFAREMAERSEDLAAMLVGHIERLNQYGVDASLAEKRMDQYREDARGWWDLMHAWQRILDDERIWHGIYI